MTLSVRKFKIVGISTAVYELFDRFDLVDRAGLADEANLGMYLTV